MKKKLPAVLLAVLLLVCIGFWQACKIPTWVSTVEGIAEIVVPIASQVAGIVDPAAAPIAQEVVAAFQVFIKALDQYKSSPNATTLQAVQAAFATAAANVQNLENSINLTGHVPEVVTSVLALVSTAVNEIANALPTTATTAKLRAAPPRHFSGDDIKAQFNALTAKHPQLHAIP